MPNLVAVQMVVVEAMEVTEAEEEDLEVVNLGKIQIDLNAKFVEKLAMQYDIATVDSINPFQIPIKLQLTVSLLLFFLLLQLHFTILELFWQLLPP